MLHLPMLTVVGYSLVQGYIVMIGLTHVAVNFMMDFFYSLANPRIRQKVFGLSRPLGNSGATGRKTQRRFMAARASAVDFSMRADSSPIPPMLMRRNRSPWSTYNAPVTGFPVQKASSPSPEMRRGGISLSGSASRPFKSFLRFRRSFSGLPG